MITYRGPFRWGKELCHNDVALPIMGGKRIGAPCKIGEGGRPANIGILLEGKKGAEHSKGKGAFKERLSKLGKKKDHSRGSGGKEKKRGFTTDSCCF